MVSERGRRAPSSPPAAGPAEVTYALAVVQPGDYQLRARLSGHARDPGDGRDPAARGRRPRQGLHPRPGRRDGAGCSAGRPTSTRAPTPRSSCSPRAATLSQVEIAPPCVNSDRAPGRVAARPAVTTTEDLADHRAQGDRRRARAAARGDADRDHRRPSSRSRRRAAAVEERAKATRSRRDDAARRAKRPARDRRRSTCPRRGSTASRRSSRRAPASGGWWTAAARPWCAPATGSGWRPILSQPLRAPGATPLVAHPRRRARPSSACGSSARRAPPPTTSPPCAARLRPGTRRAGRARPGPRRGALRARPAPRALVAALCGDRVPFDETPTARPDPGGRPGRAAGGPAASPPTQPLGPVEPPIGPPILPPQPPSSPTRARGGRPLARWRSSTTRPRRSRPSSSTTGPACAGRPPTSSGSTTNLSFKTKGKLRVARDPDRPHALLRLPAASSSAPSAGMRTAHADLHRAGPGLLRVHAAHGPEGLRRGRVRRGQPGGDARRQRRRACAACGRTCSSTRSTPRIPQVIQYNKRDLPTALPVSVLERAPQPAQPALLRGGRLQGHGRRGHAEGHHPAAVPVAVEVLRRGRRGGGHAPGIGSPGASPDDSQPAR